MIIFFVYFLVKISQFSKWISCKLQRKEPAEVRNENIESQEPAEDEMKLGNSNEGIMNIYWMIKMLFPCHVLPYLACGTASHANKLFLLN